MREVVGIRLQRIVELGEHGVAGLARIRVPQVEATHAHGVADGAGDIERANRLNGLQIRVGVRLTSGCGWRVEVEGPGANAGAVAHIGVGHDARGRNWPECGGWIDGRWVGWSAAHKARVVARRVAVGAAAGQSDAGASECVLRRGPCCGQRGLRERVAGLRGLIRQPAGARHALRQEVARDDVRRESRGAAAVDVGDGCTQRIPALRGVGVVAVVEALTRHDVHAIQVLAAVLAALHRGVASRRVGAVAVAALIAIGSAVEIRGLCGRFDCVVGRLGVASGRRLDRRDVAIPAIGRMARHHTDRCGEGAIHAVARLRDEHGRRCGTVGGVALGVGVGNAIGSLLDVRARGGGSRLQRHVLLAAVLRWARQVFHFGVLHRRQRIQRLGEVRFHARGARSRIDDAGKIGLFHAADVASAGFQRREFGLRHANALADGGAVAVQHGADLVELAVLVGARAGGRCRTKSLAVGGGGAGEFGTEAHAGAGLQFIAHLEHNIAALRRRGGEAGLDRTGTAHRHLGVDATRLDRCVGVNIHEHASFQAARFVGGFVSLRGIAVTQSTRRAVGGLGRGWRNHLHRLGGGGGGGRSGGDEQRVEGCQDDRESRFEHGADELSLTERGGLPDEHVHRTRSGVVGNAQRAAIHSVQQGIWLPGRRSIGCQI